MKKQEGKKHCLSVWQTLSSSGLQVFRIMIYKEYGYQIGKKEIPFLKEAVQDLISGD